jgi:hypothetical protein
VNFSLADHDRFFDKVKLEPSGCWRWTASTQVHGYGQFAIRLLDGRKTMARAHRLAYKVFRGDPGEKELHHTCENRWCVNPGHLVPMTRLEHVAVSPKNPWGRHVNECKNGHPFDDENTWEYDRADGCKRRVCRECSREATRRWRSRNTGVAA